MPFSLAGIGGYVILIIQLPVMVSLSVFCRRLKKKNEAKEAKSGGIVLTKDAPSEQFFNKRSQWCSHPKPPPNVPIAPPPMDPLDDTLKGVKSLLLETSRKGVRRRRRRQRIK